jgi:hypothetical protein
MVNPLDGGLWCDHGPWSVGGCELRIEFDPKVRLVASRDGCVLPSLPAAVRESGDLAWIRLAVQAAAERRRVLRDLLEEAMVEAIPLALADLELLAADPAGCSMLGSLLVEMGGLVGCPLPAERAIETLAGERVGWSTPALVTHPVRLATSGTLTAWKAWQARRWQRPPFRQVRRELYLPGEGEAPNATWSGRLAGRRARWDQARALLDGRGWYRVTKTGAERRYKRAALTAHLEFRPTGAPLAPLATILLRRLYFLPTGERARSQANPGLPLQEVPVALFSEAVRDAVLVAEIAGR